MTLRRAHFILFVADQAASTRFYARVLAIDPSLDVPGMTEVSLPGGAVLGLMPGRSITRLLGLDVDPAQVSRTPSAEVYLVVDDAAAYLARARDAGAEVIAPLTARDWGHRAGYVRDLDGHVLAFAETMDG